MRKQLAIFFIIAGSCFIAYSIILYMAAPLPFKIGFLFNILVFIFDCLWFLMLGGFFLWVGLALNREKPIADEVMVCVVMFVSCFKVDVEI